ncbi:MAG: type II toxin-antitoxin system VapC family toxin [Polyangiaceae bacterium]|nr:type II toxin-antitoxin system VapC family toxin [Polyangiaceae bacterium]
MVVVIDTSALVAVLVSEPERTALVRATQGADLVAPGSVHWEVGNAMSALLKRRRATLAQAQHALVAYAAIPIRLIDIDLALALEISAKHALYAYDAYLVACALTQRAPLLTLDHGLARAARAAGVALLGVAGVAT